jgi:hypothetical protein
VGHFLDCPDEVVAVAGLVGDQLEEDKPELPGFEGALASAAAVLLPSATGTERAARTEGAACAERPAWAEWTSPAEWTARADLIASKAAGMPSRRFGPQLNFLPMASLLLR